MKKNKDLNDVQKEVENTGGNPNEKQCENAAGEEEGNTVKDTQYDNCEDLNEDAFKEIRENLEEKSKQCEEYFNILQRTAAEFDNYKKRTAREKETLYIDAVCDSVKMFLPVLDNFERAIGAVNKENGSISQLKEGVDMIFKQLKSALESLGVEEIKSLGEKFDPTLHNAVMHVEDEAYGENTVVEEFQKGYSLKDKVIRHSMVKVAN